MGSGLPALSRIGRPSLACVVVKPRRLVAWIGGAAVLAAAVVALRHTQPPTGSVATPTTVPAPVNHLASFALEGVLLPEPGEPPATPSDLIAVPSGPHRVRVAWGSALPGGSEPANAVGYEVRWRGSDGSQEQCRLVAVPEVQLNGLTSEHYVVEVRSVDAFGRRSAPNRVHVQARDELGPGSQWSGLFETFDGSFDVDTAGSAGRWHFTGYPGCTRASMSDGQLAIDLECGGDLTILRYRSPLILNATGEPSRVLVSTDAAGPRGQLTIDLVPGPADQVGAGRDGAGPAVDPPNGTAAVDPTLPAGTIRVLVNDAGARVLTGPGVRRIADPPTPSPAPARGPGVLHGFEIILGSDGLRVLQDGYLVAVAGITPPWTQAHVLVGLSGPPGRRARVHVDTIGLSGPLTLPPAPYAHPVIPATQRLLGPAEDAPAIGISGQPLTEAASARFVTSVTLAQGVDLDRVAVQFGTAVIPARPILPVPARAGSIVTLVAELPPQLLGPTAPQPVSPLVLRAPGAESVEAPIFASYLEIQPLPGTRPDLQPPTGSLARPFIPDAMPSPTMRLLDDAGKPVTVAAPGSRVLVDVGLDRIGGQLESGTLAGIAGFELWLDNRRIAGVPTAFDGPGLGGQYVVSVSTKRLEPGPHPFELRVIPSNPERNRASRLTSLTITTP
jgi:hypothetical protein